MRASVRPTPPPPSPRHPYFHTSCSLPSGRQVDAYLQRNNVSKQTARMVRKHFRGRDDQDATADKLILSQMPLTLQKRVLQVSQVTPPTLPPLAPKTFSLNLLRRVVTAYRALPFLPPTARVRTFIRTHSGASPSSRSVVPIRLSSSRYALCSAPPSCSPTKMCASRESLPARSTFSRRASCCRCARYVQLSFSLNVHEGATSSPTEGRRNACATRRPTLHGLVPRREH